MSLAKPLSNARGSLGPARRAGRWLAVGVLLVLVSLAIMPLTFLAWSVGRVPDAVQTPTQPGQYRATSADVLGTVSVRLVFSDRGKSTPTLVFVEVNALWVPGLDRETLAREGRAALEERGVPQRVSAGSEPRTARLVHSALARAFGARVEPVSRPEHHGAAEHRAPSDLYGMWPSEFDHRCDVGLLSDGDYPGTSSNPVASLAVTLRIRSGHINGVTPEATPVSPIGRGAIQTLLPRFVAQNRVDIDILSGATQTSYALRSAVFHACKTGLRSTALAPGMKPRP